MTLRRGLRILLRVALLLVLLALVGATLVPRGLESRILSFIEADLSEMLGVPMSAACVNVDFGRSSAEIYGMRMAQPDGFGADDLLYVPELEMHIPVLPLLLARPEMDIRIANVEADIRTRADGTSNAGLIIDRVSSRESAPGTRFPFRSLNVRSFTVTNCSISYSERTASSNTVDFAVTEIAGSASDVAVAGFEHGAPGPPGTMLLTGRLHKPPFPDARLGLVAGTDTTDTNPSPLNCALRIVGFEFGALAPLLPESTGIKLGGNAADIAVDLRVSSNAVQGTAVIETIAGYRHTAGISGTPAEPTLTASNGAVASVLTRSRGALGNLAENVASAGQNVIGAATDTAAGLTQGTVRTVGSFGGGLLDTFVGIVTLNSDRIGMGFKQMSASLTGVAGDAVFTTGGEIMEGVAGIGTGLTGGERAAGWRAAVPNRWTNVWRQAVARVSGFSKGDLRRAPIDAISPKDYSSEEKEGTPMNLTSPVFENDRSIPSKYTKDGEDISPPLRWSNVPEGTRAYALMVEDPDAPGGSWVHWLMYDIPSDMRDLPEDVAKVPLVFGCAKQGDNNFGNCGYGGPAPPPPAEHRYVFQLIALDTPTGLEPGAGKKDLEQAVNGHVLAMAQLTGRYKR